MKVVKNESEDTDQLLFEDITTGELFTSDKPCHVGRIYMRTNEDDALILVGAGAQVGCHVNVNNDTVCELVHYNLIKEVKK